MFTLRLTSVGVLCRRPWSNPSFISLDVNNIACVGLPTSVICLPGAGKQLRGAYLIAWHAWCCGPHTDCHSQATCRRTVHACRKSIFFADVCFAGSGESSDRPLAFPIKKAEISSGSPRMQRLGTAYESLRHHTSDEVAFEAIRSGKLFLPLFPVEYSWDEGTNLLRLYLLSFKPELVPPPRGSTAQPF